MSQYKIVYYETENEECFIQDFINERSVNNQAKILANLSILQERGPILPRPFADILEDGIHELRIKLSGDQIRILYFFVFKDFIVLTHAFRKNSDKVPKSEIKKAKLYRDDFLKRFTEKMLRKEFKDENTK